MGRCAELCLQTATGLANTRHSAYNEMLSPHAPRLAARIHARSCCGSAPVKRASNGPDSLSHAGPRERASVHNHHIRSPIHCTEAERYWQWPSPGMATRCKSGRTPSSCSARMAAIASPAASAMTFMNGTCAPPGFLSQKNEGRTGENEPTLNGNLGSVAPRWWRQ